MNKWTELNKLYSYSYLILNKGTQNIDLRDNKIILGKLDAPYRKMKLGPNKSHCTELNSNKSKTLMWHLKLQKIRGTGRKKLFKMEVVM